MYVSLLSRDTHAVSELHGFCLFPKVSGLGLCSHLFLD